MHPVPLITGSRGRLGRAVADVLEEEYGDAFPGAVFATRDEIDLTDADRLRLEFERIRPTVVVNCAAAADVDGCEDRPEAAEAVNHAGARALARVAREAGARIIHLSTDMVFDGRCSPPRPYTERDEPNPLSVYAATKLAGERAIAEENPDHTILRSSWFFGPWPPDRWPESYLTALRQGRLLRVVADRFGSPTYLRDLARAIATLIRVPCEGVVHFTNRGDPTTRYHVVLALARRLGIDTARLIPIPEEAWTGDRAVRPRYAALDTSRWEQVTGQRPRTWQEALDEYLEERSAVIAD